MTGNAAVRIRRTAVGVALSAAMVAAPSPSMAAPPLPDAAPQGDRIMATSATRGTVQSIDAHTIVIARARDRGAMTFTLTAVTRRDGPIVVGSTVSVRYREDGRHHVAMAVALQRVH